MLKAECVELQTECACVLKAEYVKLQTEYVC